MANGQTENIANLLRAGGTDSLSVGKISNVKLTDDVKENFKVIRGGKAGERQAESSMGQQLSQMPGSQGVKVNANFSGINRGPSQQEIVEGARMFNDPGNRLQALVGTDPTTIKPQDVSQMSEPGALEGAQEVKRPGFDGVTPDGTPDAEDIKNVSKGLSNFAKALETPGVQKFLGQMGIAFSRGNPNEPGTILGKAAIDQAEGELQRRLNQAALSGEDPTQITPGELGGTPSQKTVQQATDVAQKEKRAGESFALRERRLDQFAEQLGIQRDRLNLNRLELAASQAKENIPPDVESWQYGAALDTVAQKYVDVARDTFKGTIQEFQSMISDPETGFDPNAVLSNLPANIRQRALEEARGFSQQIAAQSSNRGQANISFIPDIAQAQEARDLPVGAMVRLNGQLMQITTNEEGQKGLQRVNLGQQEQ